MIREGGYPNCSSLAKKWEVSSKTIQRDIDYLKYQLDAPIEYDSTRHGYYYTESNYRMPAINISESDLFSVVIAKRALKQFEHTPLYSKLSRIFDRIEQSLPDKTSVDPAWIDNRIFFSEIASTAVDSETWEIIARALRENRQLKIKHVAPGQKKTVTRTVDPYHLVHFKGEWYLSSYCGLRDSIRTFAVSRIKDAELLQTNFDMPEDFTREKMFGDSFGIIWDANEYDVKIEFRKEVAPYIEERTWHPEQSIKKYKDGRLVISFTTRHLNEVKDWVLSWGGDAKVQSPPELRASIKKELQNALKGY
ncbi:hypothetical protein BVX97_01465 [bacterium E08(2017)]|nr:hypothetical protein BVX97_01465 [bacterium E08(2017)]